MEKEQTLKHGDVIEAISYINTQSTIAKYKAILRIEQVMNDTKAIGQVLKVTYTQEGLMLVEDFVEIGTYLHFYIKDVIRKLDDTESKEHILELKKFKARMLLNELCDLLEDGDEFRLDDQINLAKSGDLLVFESGNNVDGDQYWANLTD